MNGPTPADHPAFHYYDSDYPGRDTTPVAANFDATTVHQGLAHDVDRYLEAAREAAGPVLELCAGTGRVAIPLARQGHEVTAVDVSDELLRQCAAKLAREDAAVAARVTLVEDDVRDMVLPRRDHALAVIAFNSLLCIPDAEGQTRALAAAARHLCPGGRLLVDVVNPWRLKAEGDATPRPFFTRVNVHTGRRYTRFAMVGPFDEDQKQELYGWYDEFLDDGVIQRRPYSMHWRPIYRNELRLMLEAAGFRVARWEGGHQGEAFTAVSPRMFVTAVREGGGA